jgi:hypothetical protein
VSGGAFSSASDDEVGGFHARLREQLKKGETFATTPKKTRQKLSRSACTPLQIRYCFGSVHRLSQNAGLQQQTITQACTAAEAGLGEPVVVRGDLECQARRRSVRVRVAP